MHASTCEDIINGYICHCSHGYTGVHCETGGCIILKGPSLGVCLSTVRDQTIILRVMVGLGNFAQCVHHIKMVGDM